MTPVYVLAYWRDKDRNRVIVAHSRRALEHTWRRVLERDLGVNSSAHVVAYYVGWKVEEPVQFAAIRAQADRVFAVQFFRDELARRLREAREYGVPIPDFLVRCPGDEDHHFDCPACHGATVIPRGMTWEELYDRYQARCTAEGDPPRRHHG